MSATDTRTLTIARRESDSPKPLSSPQERLFLLDQITPGLAAYNVPTLVKVPATLDDELLRRALDLVVARHEILRTTIELRDGVPLQSVSPTASADLAVVESVQALAELARRPFKLDGDVLLRAGLVHASEGEDLLLIVFHHIVSDHTSSALLFAELDTAYLALAAGREPDLPELAIQYADFACWQREQLTGSRLEELLEYWTERLKGAPDHLELPSDRRRPSVQSYRGALREFTIEERLAASLRDLARSRGVSLFMVLQAAFKTLLHRYTGAEDLVIGVPVSGRHYEETLPLLGCFSNTLALRTDLSGDPTFAELLERVKLTTLEAQVYQELPFEKLVEVLNPERVQSHAPIFQVLLGFDVAPANPPVLAGMPLEQLPVPGWEWARFDLSLVLRESPDQTLHAYLEYATDLFDIARIERMVEHLTTLLEGVVRDPGKRLSELPILTESERCKLLIDCNATERAYDRRCLHELISEQAARTPGAVAVVSAEGRVTYDELERSSNQLAHELIALGAGPGELVAICAERSAQLVVALLGVLKSGAAYVPVDPTFPPARQEFMLADAGAKVLLTEEHFVGMLDPGRAAVVCLDRDRERIAGRGAESPRVTSTPEQLAYVIYTSGSTGRPKGVEISHRALVNFLLAMRERPGLSGDDTLLAVTTLSFDIAGLELYLPLIVGARVVITPSEATMDGVELADWLARSGATFMQATPTTWQLLVDAGWKGSAGLTIACGGEALPRALTDELLGRCKCLWHMYGPTETTIWSSSLRLGDGDGPPPLGGPIANTSFYVLDAHRNPVPVGVPGELWIGGDGLADGYHARAELTAEKFVDDPNLGGRLYCSGDLVSWRDDGTLAFHGRIDQQVKLRGFRIELGEIETLIASDPDVASAVAILREDTPGDRRIVAYLLPRDGAAPDVERLRRLLKGKLPPFMVPATFVTLQALPTTPNGKLDRKALPAPDGARPDLERRYAPPETPVQEALATIWADVLAVEEVGIDDDFFDLGGHSLLAVKMVARVHDNLGVELYLRQLFDGPTIRELSAAITAQMLDAATDDDLASLLAEVEASP